MCICIKRDINTRQFEKIKFKTLRPNIKKAPVYYGAQLWDKLPLDMQVAVSYVDFKHRVRRHIPVGLFEVAQVLLNDLGN